MNDQKQDSKNIREGVQLKIEPYKIDREIRRTSEFVLFLAIHSISKDPYYVKVFLREFQGSEAEFSLFRKKLLDCMELPDALFSQKVFEMGLWERLLYQVLEYFESIPLLEYIETNPLPLKASVEIIEKIAHALHAFHAVNLPFGAFCINNVVILEGDFIKLIEGGLAPWIGPPTFFFSYYLSPEFETSGRQFTEKGDIYSLGVVAYEIILSARSQGAFNLTLLPEKLQKIISRSLQNSSEDRYPNSRILLEDLHQYGAQDIGTEQEEPLPKQMNQFFETLKSFQLKIIPPLPHWKNAEIGVCTFQGLELTGVYYDFFEIAQDASYGIILGETSAKGVEGVFTMAFVKGLITPLARTIQNPRDFIFKLNEYLVAENLEMPLNLVFIKLKPEKKQLQFISCGYAKLLYLPHNGHEIVQLTTPNFALGITAEIEVHEVESDWHPGDLIFINTYGIEDTQAQLDDELVKNASKKSQELVDYIFQKSKKWMGKNWIYKSLTLMGVKYDPF